MSENAVLVNSLENIRLYIGSALVSFPDIDQQKSSLVRFALRNHKQRLEDTDEDIKLMIEHIQKGTDQ